MNEIMVAFGIACVVTALYRLGVLYKALSQQMVDFDEK